MGRWEPGCWVPSKHQKAAAELSSSDYHPLTPALLPPWSSCPLVWLLGNSRGACGGYQSMALHTHLSYSCSLSWRRCSEVGSHCSLHQPPTHTHTQTHTHVCTRTHRHTCTHLPPTNVWEKGSWRGTVEGHCGGPSSACTEQSPCKAPQNFKPQRQTALSPASSTDKP